MCLNPSPKLPRDVDLLTLAEHVLIQDRKNLYQWNETNGVSGERVKI